MSELAGFDLEQSSARAWTRFQARLADRLAALGVDEGALVEVEVGLDEDDLEGAAPYAQLTGLGDGLLRGEVSSNAYLDDRYRLDEEQQRRLVELGWHEPATAPGTWEEHGTANFFADVARREADRLAVMVVRALREVFGVAHPAFLRADDLSDGEGPVEEPCPAAPGPAEPLAAHVDGYDDLQQRVEQALVPMLGEVERDDDGDIPVPCGTALVWVRVEQDAPVVQLFSVVVDGLVDRKKAAFEVNVLNRDVRFVKFVHSGRRIVAHANLPAWPFVPEHLRSMLAGMATKLDEVGGDLVTRLGGRRAIEPDDDPDDQTGVGSPSSATLSVDATLDALLHLDADPDHRLDPELAAGVCRFDEAVIVTLLDKVADQEVVWSKHREVALEGRELDEADFCQQQLAKWQRTTALLRRTLWLVAERSMGREGTDGPPYWRPTPIPLRRRPPRFRGSMAPRSPRSQRVHNAAELLALYDVEDLVTLDERLTECSGAEVEVLDLDDVIEVSVEGECGRLPYPFTSADFHALLEHVHERAFEQEE